VGLELWFVALVLGIAALVVELTRLVRWGRKQPNPAAATNPSTVTPTAVADGVVGIRPLPGVRSVPNLRDPRFRRFECIQPEGSAATPAASRSEVLKTPPALVGNWVVVSVFVGFDGRLWADTEIAQSLAAFERAGAWIEQEARRYGVGLELEFCDTYFSADGGITEPVEIGFAIEGNDVGPWEAGFSTRMLALLSRAASQLGFQDAVDLVERIERNLLQAKTAWVMHLRRAGRSMAVPPDLTQLEGVSLIVCHAREASFTEPLTKTPNPDPVTFAHELLHLFGASDKYSVPLERFPSGSVTRRDIMRLDRGVLDALAIDPLTAAEIGWPPRVDPPPESAPSQIPSTQTRQSSP
jgi:hypothetical protein